MSTSGIDLAPAVPRRGGRPSKARLASVYARLDHRVESCQSCDKRFEPLLPAQCVCSECRAAAWLAWEQRRRRKRRRPPAK
jgi:hypothetical protein